MFNHFSHVVSNLGSFFFSPFLPCNFMLEFWVWCICLIFFLNIFSKWIIYNRIMQGCRISFVARMRARFLSSASLLMGGIMSTLFVLWEWEGIHTFLRAGATLQKSMAWKVVAGYFYNTGQMVNLIREFLIVTFLNCFLAPH